MDSYNGGEDSRKEIEKVLMERAYSLSRTSACRGKVSGNGFDENGKYKLYIQGNDYCIERDIDSDGIQREDSSVLQKWASEEKTVLREDEYSCKLLDGELTCVTKPNLVGEAVIKVNDIGLQFTLNTGEVFTFYCENTPENTKPIYRLLKNAGVKSYFNIVDIPEDVFPIKSDRGNGFLGDGCMYLLFRKEGRLFFIRPESNDPGYVIIAEIGINEIRFYRQEGSLHYEQSISGSGGASNSYGGAIVGGLLFGAAGAIIGSRKNETPVNISSTTVKHDTRIIVLSIKRNSRPYNISFPMEAEGIFDWLIPEKQYDYVISERRRAFEKEDIQLFGKDADENSEAMKRLFTVKQPEIPGGSNTIADEPQSAVPILIDNNTVKCPVCGRLQNSNRTKCQKCGIYFHG